MVRQVQAVILIAVLLWQSLGMLGSAAVEQRAGELTHVAVHWQSVEHHHHADHALHLGENDAAPEGGVAQHQHPDSGFTPTGLVLSHQFALAPTRSQSLVEALQTVWLSATLDGLLRPPKLLT